jgi:anaerobic magnesium-protoporphyrin IX monomethyl ester cyclase
MEKICLLNPPGDKQYQRDMYCSGVSKGYYYWQPIDLLVQSGILGREYDVHVIDAIADRLSQKECLQKIRGENYKAVLFLTGIASWKKDMEFISQLDSGETRPLLIGNGDILLYESKNFLNNYSFLDAVLLDYTSPDALHYLKKDYASLRSMAFRLKGKIEVRREPVRAGHFSFPVPHHEKFHLKNYLLAHGKRFPFTTAMTNYGCPFKCSFCPASVLGFKYRPVNNVMEELRYIVSLGIQEVFFTDFTFEARRKNTLEMCRRIQEEKLDLSWVCSSRANTLDRELIENMKAAGCHTVLLGVENGDESLLKRYSKGVTKDQIRKAFSLCREMEIRTLGHFIIGLPGESEESARKTIDFAKELDCDIASFNIAIPALGTPLREAALKNGWMQTGDLEFDASETYPVLETPGFSRKQAWEWQHRAIREFYFRFSYIWKMATSSRSAYEWKVLFTNGFAVLRNSFRRNKQE